MIARVLVDIKSKNVDKTYDYKIPQNYIDIIEIGTRVVVPFGKREIMGFCLEITETTEYKKELKAILRIIDIKSYLTEELITLARNIKSETGSLLISILETMLPAALKVVYRPKLQVIDRVNIHNDLKEDFEYADEVLLESISKDKYKTIKTEIKKKHLKQVYSIKSRNKSLSFKYIKLTKKPINKLTSKQLSVIDYLKNNNDKAKLLVIKAKLNLSTSVVNALEKKGYVTSFYQEHYRKISNVYENIDKNITLNEEQEKAYNEIVNSIGKPEIYLLHGVTGSGKTEIYLKVIDYVRKHGLSVIFLVPEISLTPMVMSRFKAKFKADVAVLHSGLSTLEKYDEWRRIVNGEASIVVGARSACFAPVKNLGLVVVDESHESTYKQNKEPNYYAIDVLMKRIKYYKSVMILGTATPNIDSYARQARGYYKLLSLKKRALNSAMPKIEVVDMKEETKKGNTSSISEVLNKKIFERLNKKEQVILLINRRGYSNFVICRNCGYVFNCENCDISLTYHEHSHSLKCHYCGHEEKVPKVCKKCSSEDLRFMGSGTQKIESDLRQMYPNAKIIRMDNDTTRTKNSHEKLLHEFEKNGDILLGTQMIAKGLDFPKVTLVGILQADNNLYVSDFRAPEKTFQLIMQVSGRAGRREIAGNVVVQAFNPNHYAIKYACNNDYLGFYKYEMNLRRIAKYSPYYYLIQLKLYGNNIREVFYDGIEVVKYLKRNLNNSPIVLGPAIPEVKRIKNRFICEVLIKYRKLGNLNLIINSLMNDHQSKNIYISIDRYLNVG